MATTMRTLGGLILFLIFFDQSTLGAAALFLGNPQSQQNRTDTWCFDSCLAPVPAVVILFTESGILYSIVLILACFFALIAPGKRRIRGFYFRQGSFFLYQGGQAVLYHNTRKRINFCMKSFYFTLYRPPIHPHLCFVVIWHR